MYLTQLDFQAFCYKSPDRFIGVEVKDIQGNDLVLRAYLLSCYARKFPRTHTFALLTILDAPGTPPDLLTQLNSTFSLEAINKSHINFSHQLIERFEVKNFANLAYNPGLWKDDLHKHYAFDQTTLAKDYQDLMQGDFLIRVKQTKLLDHLKVGMRWRFNVYEISAFWYLENYDMQPAGYLALYRTSGNKWMYHEGEAGKKGKRYPMKGMRVYGSVEKLKAVPWIEQKIADEAYQLVYKNYDTAFGIEEEFRDEQESK